MVLMKKKWGSNRKKRLYSEMFEEHLAECLVDT